MTNAPLVGLRCRREFHNLSLSHMGRLIGVSMSHYRKFEQGLVRLDVHRAKVLADHLGCTIDELL